MPIRHFFSNTFSKIAKRWGLSTFNLQFWWAEVT